ncbi:MAG TPA: FxLYD domain-containing protein [Sumerlaeia bacterium]|nr:FxLYD domain-containing protein [Sumerlaeia bacterium]
MKCPFFIAGFCLTVALAPAGCRSPGEMSLGESVNRLSLSGTLAQADKRFAEKQYRVAAALYRQALEDYPEGEKRERIYVQIGRCFYNDQVQSLHDAQAAYSGYLERYPQGVFRQEVTDELTRIRMVRANREEEVRRKYDQAEGDVEKIQAALNEQPYDAELHLRMGHALWELERYDEALQHYLKSQEINAALKEYDLLKKRMMVDEDGKIVPLTPDAARQIEREQKPLIIFGVNEYKSRIGRGVLGAREVYYNVQGMVRNQSSRLLRNVAIEVVFLNPAREQLDVQRSYVGDLPPGAVRAFGVQARRYDDIYNIAGYECRAYEQ